MAREDCPAIERQDRGVSEIVQEKLVSNIHSDQLWRPFLHKAGRAPVQVVEIDFKVTAPQAEGATAGVGSDR